MSKAFDIGIDALSRPGALPVPTQPASPLSSLQASINPVPASSPESGTKRFYIETFGCQMNAHDSEKVSGVLLSRGYKPVLSAAQADLVLYNTCSIREKA